jgi:hypothetical protein
MDVSCRVSYFVFPFLPLMAYPTRFRIMGRGDSFSVVSFATDGCI